MRFKTHAKLGGFIKVLADLLEVYLPNNNAELDALTGLANLAVRKIKAALRNDKVISSFTLAFTTNKLLDVVMESQTTDWLED